jgi:hypothetical protein
MGKSLPVSVFKKLARLIADHAQGPSLSSTLHGPALSAPRAPAGPCALSGSTSEPTQEQIERRSYELWQQAGFPSGRDEEFRRQAERELRGASVQV